jgi:hypothetical protein
MLSTSPAFGYRWLRDPLVESKTSEFHRVGMENAIPDWHSPHLTEPLTMKAYAVDARRKPRFKLVVDIWFNSRTCGVLKGRTVDISESGIGAMLRIEVPLGEVVELNFTLPLGPVAIHAIGRQKNAFRFGFQFIESNAVHELIRRTCRQLAVEQSLTEIA